MSPVLNLEVHHKIGCYSNSKFLIIVANVNFFFFKNTFLLFEVFQVSDLSVCRRWRPYRSVSRLQDPVPVFDTGFA